MRGNTSAWPKCGQLDFVAIRSLIQEEQNPEEVRPTLPCAKIKCQPHLTSSQLPVKTWACITTPPTSYTAHALPNLPAQKTGEPSLVAAGATNREKSKYNWSLRLPGLKASSRRPSSLLFSGVKGKWSQPGRTTTACRMESYVKNKTFLSRKD